MSSSAKPTPPRKTQRAARLQWVPIADTRISPAAQRDHVDKARVDYLVANFDLEQLGTPTVSYRDGVFYIIDGAHRIAALKDIGWGDQQVQCWTYEGLSEREEAERFLKLNNVRAVSALDKYRVAITAELDEECDIDRILRAAGLRVTTQKADNGISAVGTLRKAYRRGYLPLTVRVIRDSYGGPGFASPVLDGISLLCQRYGDQVNERDLIERLGSVAGGVNGLLGNAAIIKRQTLTTMGTSVAAAAVDVYNRGRRGPSRLQSWWRDEDNPS